MDKYEITVIVPIYQVEGYIEKCIQSIAGASMFEQCEVLLINDGSRDGSADIASKYVAQYKNCFLLEKKNGGAGSARNLGMRKAKGKYLYFVDGDDFISSDRVEKLYRCAESLHCDMVLASYQGYRGTDCGTVCNRDYLVTSEPIAGRAMIKLRMDYSDWTNQSFTALVRRELIQDGGIFFPEENVIYEDIIWMNKCLMTAERVSYIPDYGYYYRKREGSAVSHLNGVSRKDITDSVKCLAGFRRWYDYAYDRGRIKGTENIGETDRQLIGRLALRMVTMPVEYSAGVGWQERRQCFRQIKKMDWGAIFRKSAKTGMERMKALLYSFGVPLFALGMRIYRGKANGID